MAKQQKRQYGLRFHDTLVREVDLEAQQLQISRTLFVELALEHFMQSLRFQREILNRHRVNDSD